MGGVYQRKSHKGVGRPTDFTPETINKLEQAFAIDSTVEEACSYAEISRQTFYDWMKKNPQFSDRIEELRQKPLLKARQTVVQKLGESYSNSMDYLKRKRKLEFGDSSDLTSGGEKISSILNEINTKAKEESDE